LRKTDGLSHEALQPGPQGEMCPFNVLRLGFANSMFSGLEMTTVHVGTIGREMVKAQRCQQCFSRSEDVVLMGPHYIREDHSRSVIHGRPKPSLLGVLPNDTPHRIDFCCFHWLDLNTHLAWIHVLDGQIVDVLALRLFFFTRQ
jgi:hypothetical protein